MGKECGEKGNTYQQELKQPQKVNPVTFVEEQPLSRPDKDILIAAYRLGLKTEEDLLRPDTYPKYVQAVKVAIHEQGHAIPLVAGGGQLLSITVIPGEGYLGLTRGLPNPSHPKEHWITVAAGGSVAQAMFGEDPSRGCSSDFASIKQLGGSISEARVSALSYINNAGGRSYLLEAGLYLADRKAA